MNRGPRVVVLGVMGQAPFAGMAWQVLHYLEGFRRLSWDVYYVEDTGEWPYDPEQNAVTADCRYTIRYLERLMRWCGLDGRWAYRNAAEDDGVYGVSSRQFPELFEDADLLVNVTGSTVLKPEHLRVPRRIYLETDPVLPQIEVALGDTFTIGLLESHTHHFTYGENIGTADCPVPTGPFRYQATRPPVVLDWWTPGEPAGSDAPFTTVSNWRQSAKDVVWNGELYTWSKHHQFLRFLDLPRRSSQPLELALAGGEDDRQTLRQHGWRVRDALSVSLDIEPYRSYVQASKGEFTVAKDQYARLRSGWFSDRSVCYLAAGKPVVTQDTCFSGTIPVGDGLFAYDTHDEALAALAAIEAAYPAQSRAAREIAAEYFSAERVVADMTDRAA